MHNNPQEHCEWCQGEFAQHDHPVHFAEKPFHPWCRDQFEDELYGPDESIDITNEPHPWVSGDEHEAFVTLNDMLNFF